MARFVDDSSNTTHFESDVMVGVRQDNAVSIKGAAAGSGVTIVPVGNDANIGLTIQGKGTGSVTLIGGATQFALNLLTVNGAIPVRPSASYMITKAGVLADTLAAPTAGTDDGVKIVITSATAFAHTITATGLLQTGTASVNVATFAAFAGASLTLLAYNGKWVVLNSNGITFS